MAPPQFQSREERQAARQRGTGGRRLENVAFTFAPLRLPVPPPQPAPPPVAPPGVQPESSIPETQAEPEQQQQQPQDALPAPPSPVQQRRASLRRRTVTPVEVIPATSSFPETGKVLRSGSRVSEGSARNGSSRSKSREGSVPGSGLRSGSGGKRKRGRASSASVMRMGSTSPILEEGVEDDEMPRQGFTSDALAPTPTPSKPHSRSHNDFSSPAITTPTPHPGRRSLENRHNHNMITTIPRRQRISNVTSASIASVTPKTRGQRRRQPSPDKFLTPEDGGVVGVYEGERSVNSRGVASPVVGRGGRFLFEVEETQGESEEEEGDGEVDETDVVQEEEGDENEEVEGEEEEEEEREEEEEEQRPASPPQKTRTVQSSRQRQKVAPEPEPEPEESESEGAEEEAAEEEGEDEEEEEPSAPPPKRRKPSPKKKPTKSRTRLPRSSNSPPPDPTVPITVHRLSHHPTFRPPFSSSSTINPLDTISQIFRATLSSSLSKQKSRVAQRAVEAYADECEVRLLALVDALDSNAVLARRVRQVGRRKVELRDELVRLRRERERVLVEIDEVRGGHERGRKVGEGRGRVNGVVEDIMSARVVGGGRWEREVGSVDGVNVPQQLVGLEALVRGLVDRTSEGASEEELGDGMSTGGMFERIRSFNLFLERAEGLLRESNERAGVS